MNLNCIIVDDEPLSRMFLKRFCEKSGRVTVKEVFEKAADAISYLETNQVHVIFLDVEMPGINGFQMLDNLPTHQPKVIMITSKTDYAYTAFEYNVTDFLKKPVDYNRFLDALDKAEEACKSTPSQEDKNSFVIKCNGSYIRLEKSSIYYIEGMGDYVKYVTSTKTFIAHSTLKAVEDSVSKDDFLKVHRSYIVNITKINDYTDNVITINGLSIPVSKSNKPLLLQKLRSV